MSLEHLRKMRGSAIKTLENFLLHVEDVTSYVLKMSQVMHVEDVTDHACRKCHGSCMLKMSCMLKILHVVRVEIV